MQQPGGAHAEHLKRASAGRSQREKAIALHRHPKPCEAVRSQYRGTRYLDVRVALHEHDSTNPPRWHRWVYEQLRIPPCGSDLELGIGLAWRLAPGLTFAP